MSAKTPRVQLRVQDGIAEVCLSRPEAHNAMDLELMRALIDTAKQLRKDRRIRAVILHGEGKSFCAGIDIKSVLGAGPLKAVLNFLPLYKPRANRYQNVNLLWRELGVPVIAAIHGNCFGAGMQLALGADIRIAHPAAKLAIMEAKWGLIPDMGGMLTLREILPRDVAFELITTGRVLDGQEASALGLVSHLADDPLAAAHAMAQAFCAKSPDALAATKRLFAEAWTPEADGTLAAERKWQRRIIGRANQRAAGAKSTGKAAEYLPRQI